MDFTKPLSTKVQWGALITGVGIMVGLTWKCFELHADVKAGRTESAAAFARSELAETNTKTSMKDAMDKADRLVRDATDKADKAEKSAAAAIVEASEAKARAIAAEVSLNRLGDEFRPKLDRIGDMLATQGAALARIDERTKAQTK